MEDGKRTNQGYAITQSITVGDTEFVLGVNRKAPDSFVTWQCSNRTDYCWGHYTGSLLNATKDLCERALAEAEYQIEMEEEKKKKEIRFIDPHYKELFRIKDGEKIVITTGDGEKTERECHFIDEFHTRVGCSVFHICEFAEIMQRAGSTYEPKEKQDEEKGQRQGMEKKSEKNGWKPKSKNKERER